MASRSEPQPCKAPRNVLSSWTKRWFSSVTSFRKCYCWSWQHLHKNYFLPFRANFVQFLTGCRTIRKKLGNWRTIRNTWVTHHSCLHSEMNRNPLAAFFACPARPPACLGKAEVLGCSGPPEAPIEASQSLTTPVQTVKFVITLETFSLFPLSRWPEMFYYCCARTWRFTYVKHSSKAVRILLPYVYACTPKCVNIY